MFVLRVTGAQPGFEAVTVTLFVSRACPTVGGAVPVSAGVAVLRLSAKHNDTNTGVECECECKCMNAGADGNNNATVGVELES
jgi:hypothetical protein